MRKMYSKKQIEGMAKAVADSEFDSKLPTAEIGASQIDTGEQADGKVMMANGEGGVKFGVIEAGGKVYLHNLSITLPDNNQFKMALFTSSNSAIDTIDKFVNLFNLPSMSFGKNLPFYNFVEKGTASLGFVARYISIGNAPSGDNFIKITSITYEITDGAIAGSSSSANATAISDEVIEL